MAADPTSVDRSTVDSEEVRGGYGVAVPIPYPSGSYLLPTARIHVPRMPSTVLICAVDPAVRAQARVSFTGPGWYVFECAFDDLPQVARSVKIDAVVVINTTGTPAARLVREAFEGAGAPIEHVLHVRRAERARDAAAAALHR